MSRGKSLSLPVRYSISYQEQRRRHLPIFGQTSAGGAQPQRPTTRGECVDGPRPCPWVSCRHHTYAEVHESSGTIQIHAPDVPVWEMAESCSLDVADRGAITLEEVGQVLNVTRERARQLEVAALFRLRRAEAIAVLDPEWEPAGPMSKPARSK